MIVVADTSPIQPTQFTGTLGILAAADKIGSVGGVRAYARLLSETSFRFSASLEKRFLEELRGLHLS
jgi:predicted nucleic acid-binding protein